MWNNKLKPEKAEKKDEPKKKNEEISESNYTIDINPTISIITLNLKGINTIN